MRSVSLICILPYCLLIRKAQFSFRRSRQYTHPGVFIYKNVSGGFPPCPRVGPSLKSYPVGDRQSPSGLPLLHPIDFQLFPLHRMRKQLASKAAHCAALHIIHAFFRNASLFFKKVKYIYQCTRIHAFSTKKGGIGDRKDRRYRDYHYSNRSQPLSLSGLGSIIFTPERMFCILTSCPDSTSSPSSIQFTGVSSTNLTSEQE